MTLLSEVLAERFPTAEQVEAESHQPIPPAPYRKGGIGFTRWELLLLQAKRAAS